MEPYFFFSALWCRATMLRPPAHVIEMANGERRIKRRVAADVFYFYFFFFLEGRKEGH